MQSNRFRNYFNNHKVVMIGLILYIVAYILNNIFPPFVDYVGGNPIVLSWEKDMASGGFLDAYIPEVLPGNRFLEWFPLDILYFGVADMAAVVHYGIFFPAALVTYFSYLLQKVLEKAMNPVTGRIEKILTFHFYNNVMFYPLSFLMMFLQNNGDIIPDKLIALMQGVNQHTAIKIILGIIFIVGVAVVLLFFFVPMVVNLLYFFGYLIVFDVFVDVIEVMDVAMVGKFLKDAPFLHELVSFLVAFLIIGLGNLLLEKILDVAQRISILPARKIAKLIQKRRQRRNRNA